MDVRQTSLDELLENGLWLGPLARALTSDVDAAEDALQDTWVAAVEDASAPKSNPRSWLRAVLRHRVYRGHRSSERRKRRERLAARSESVPSEAELIEKLEMQRRVAEAVVALPDRYREVILLRFYGDVPPRQIASRLGVPVDTVYTQLRRGLDRLRQSLDSSFGGRETWCVALLPFLAAQQGRVAASPGWLAKAAVAGTLVLLVVISVVFVGQEIDQKGVVHPVAGTDVANAPAPAAQVESGVTRSPQPEPVPTNESGNSPQTSTVSADTELEGSRHALPGIVRDGLSEEPLPQVHIRVFEPAQMTLHDLVAKFGDRIQMNTYGGLEDADDWLGPRRRLSPLERLAGKPFDVYDTVTSRDTDAPCYSETHSNAEGQFRIAIPPNGGVVVATLVNYGVGTWILVDDAKQVELDLWRPWRLEGFVIDPDGERLREPLQLFLDGDGAAPLRVETAADGSFSATVAARRIRARALTLGWQLRAEGIHPVHRQRWVFRTNFPHDLNEPAILVAHPVPILRVSDAQGHPVTDFHWLVVSPKSEFAESSGRLLSQSGILELDDQRLQAQMRPTGSPSEPARLFVWSDGYRSYTEDLDDFPWPDVLDVTLAQGVAEALTGHVLDGGVALAHCQISVLPYRSIDWREDERRVLAMTTTDEHGVFAVPMPPGQWVVRAQLEEDRALSTVVTLPDDNPVVIDTSVQSSIFVTVRDTEGVVQTQHDVALRGADGRSARRETDDSGVAYFSGLSAGAYKVFTPHVTTKSSFVGEVSQEVTVEAGEEARVELLVRAPAEPIYPRLVSRGFVTYEGWTARDHSYGDRVQVAFDGTVPIDVQLSVRAFEVERPNGDRWKVPVQSPVAVPYTIQIPPQGATYQGRLLKNGRPWQSVRVRARLVGKQATTAIAASAVTGSDGEFEIPCCYDEVHAIEFRPDAADYTFIHRHEVATVTYLPAEKPSDSAPLTIDVGPYLDPPVSTISGMILDAAGNPVPRAWLSIDAVHDHAHGTVSLRRGGKADEAGHYRLAAPVAPRYEIRASDPKKGSARHDWRPDGHGDLTRDLRLDPPTPGTD